MSSQNARSAVLVLHGLAGNVTEMSSLRKRLAREGYHVHVPTLPGHSTHYCDLKTVRWQDYAEFVDAEFETLAKEYDQVYVAGLCLGALLALNLAIDKGNRLAGVIPISTTFYFDGWAVSPLARFLAAFRWTPMYYLYDLPERHPYGIKNERIRTKVLALMAKAGHCHYSKIPFRAFWQMNCLARKVALGLNRIRAPVMAIHPLEDDVASIRNLDMLEKGIVAPFRKLVLRDSYHIATIDQEKELVCDAAAAFFSEIGQGFLASIPMRLSEIEQEPVILLPLVAI